MTGVRSAAGPRFVYDRRYVEPEIELLVAEPFAIDGPAQIHLLNRVRRYTPTGTRTAGGLYEYELVEESSLV